MPLTEFGTGKTEFSDPAYVILHCNINNNCRKCSSIFKKKCSWDKYKTITVVASWLADLSCRILLFHSLLDSLEHVTAHARCILDMLINYYLNITANNNCQ